MIAIPIEIDPAWVPGAAPGEYAVRWDAAEQRMLKKPRPLLPSAWCERHRVVPADSFLPGMWKNVTTPYIAGIMDASFSEGVQEIYFCAPPQTAKSEFANNCLGYAEDRRPGNALVVYPDELTGRENMRDRILPMFRDSPRLRAYLSGADDDETSICLRLRHAKVHIAWANSAARLGNKPLPYVICDEVDKYPPTAGKREAGPVDLARKRQRTFAHMRRLWLISTPTVEDGLIWVALTEWADAVFDYWVRCPRCGGDQEMVFKRVRWEGGGSADPREVERRRLAWYECAHCSARWDDAARNAAVARGQWRERSRGVELFTCLSSLRPMRIGFHLRAYVSPMVSLSESAAAFLWGLKDKTRMKDFMNAHEAEPWRVYEKQRDESKMLELCDGRPAGRVPSGGVVAGITCGVDTQDDGCWFIVVAWPWAGHDLVREPHVVRMGFLADFGAVARVLWDDAYLDADGLRYSPALCLQDSAGHRTSEVYAFCRKHPGKIVPTIGRDTMAQPYAWGNVEYWPGTKKPIPGGLKLLNVNTKFFKDDLARRLEILPGDPGGVRFCGDGSESGGSAGALGLDYARHFCAEYLDEKGLWACPSGRPNHLWDCLVLASAAYEVCGMAHWAPAGKRAPAAASEGRERKKPWVERPKRWVS